MLESLLAGSGSDVAILSRLFCDWLRCFAEPS